MNAVVRWAPALLIVCGATTAAAAMFADRGGGIGALQGSALGIGALAVLFGLALLTPGGQSRAAGWQRTISTTERPAGVFVLAALFGLLAGWGQVGVQFARRNMRHEMIGMGLDYPWMIPVATLAIFLLIGLALLPLQNRWPQRFGPQSRVTVFAFAAFFCLLLLVRHIHTFALFLLALGLAAQVARIAARGPWLDRVARFSVGWPTLLLRPPQDDPSDIPSRRDFVIGAGAAIGAMAIGIRGREAVRERRSLQRLPAASGRPPDVLLIVLDTVRAASLSLLGYERPTSPGLDRLASHGVNFTRSFAPSSWTLPSHASMFTGQWPHDLSVGPWSSLDATYPTLAEYLRDHGYNTAGFVANREYCGHEFGLSRGFIHYEDYQTTPGQALLYTTPGNFAMQHLRAVQALRTYDNFGRKSAEQLTSDFLRWHDREAGAGPIFAFLNYWDAHDPYTPPKMYAERFAPSGSRGGTPPVDPPDPERLAELVGHYDASIAYADAQVAYLLDTLSQRGAMDNTLAVVLSDHGEHFGEHGLMLHGGSLYAQELHVPLLLVHPSVAPAGQVVSEPVSLRGFAATVADLLGLETTSPFPGLSWARAWKDGVIGDPVLSEADRVQHLSDSYPAARGRLASLVAGDFHYIVREYDRGEELYDVVADPVEAQDLASLAAWQPELVAMRGRLSAALAA